MEVTTLLQLFVLNLFRSHQSTARHGVSSERSAMVYGDRRGDLFDQSLLKNRVSCLPVIEAINSAIRRRRRWEQQTQNYRRLVPVWAMATRGRAFFPPQAVWAAQKGPRKERKGRTRRAREKREKSEEEEWTKLRARFRLIKEHLAPHKKMTN